MRWLIVLVLAASIIITAGCEVSLEAPDYPAYAKVYFQTYSDDADPEDEGVEVLLRFFDKKSQPMRFTGVDMEIDVELYAYPIETRQEVRALHAPEELVYQGTFYRGHTYHPVFDSRMPIRIPFEDMNVNFEVLWDWYFGNVIITTPRGVVLVAE